MIGERRGGCNPIDLTGAGFGGTGSISTTAPTATSWAVIGITLAPNGVVGLGNSASGGFGSAVNTYTAAYSVNASSDFLVVCVLGDATNDKVTGVTFNGVAMTQFVKLNGGASLGWLYVYALANPATGSHNVVISASGSCSTLGFQAADYVAVKTSGEPDSSITQTIGAGSSYSADYLIVGGGGGGGFSAAGSGVLNAGGGGAGGLLTGTTTIAPATNYGVTIGLGGNYAANGSNTVLATIGTAVGGGVGGPYLGQGNAGGSGGGSGGDSGQVIGGAGTGGQGNAGGRDGHAGNASGGGGGAGGAGAPGSDVSNGVCGVGGPGVSNSLSGSAVVYAVGGSGGVGSVNGSTPGSGGGGSAGDGSSGVGGNGANGIVIIRYTGPQVATGGTITTDGTHTIHTFTSNGTFGSGGTAAMSVTTNFAPVANSTWALAFVVSAQNHQTSVAGGALRVFTAISGSLSASLVDSNGPLLAQTAVVEMTEWFPLGDQYNSELWAIAALPNSTQPVTLSRRSTLSTGTYVWSQVTPADPILTLSPDIYLTNAQPLDGLLFWAYNSGIDRTHVWEPATNTLRRTGLAQPGAAPTAANGGGGGGVTGARYYRIRYIQKSTTSAKIIRRSEPSASSTQFTPDAAHANVTVTFADTAPGEGETHREVEASTDNATFTRIATVAIATGTYADTLNATDISKAGPTSEAIGAYLLQPAARYLVVDNDRLVGLGHTFDPTRFSQVWYAPTGADPGVGNGERLPIVTTGGTAINTSNTLDNNVGGPITGGASGLLQPQYASTSSPTSIIYVFKWQRIYMLVGTGDVTAPYKVVTVSSKRGAVQDSVFTGIDEGGNPAVYFLDPLFGPSRITTTHGIETLPGLRTTWARVNVAAADVVACGLYYPYKRQAMWWVSVDGGNTPMLRIRYTVGETGHVAASAADYVRGWAIDDGRLAQARCCATYTELVSNNGAVNLSIRPIIGLSAPDYIQRTDVDSTDAGQPFTATLISRPYMAAGLATSWGSLGAGLLADAQASGVVNLFFIRDFGLETFGPFPVSTAASPENESKIIKWLDDMVASEARYIQIEFTDSSTAVLN